MMTKKDYIRAAAIIQSFDTTDVTARVIKREAADAFVEFFRGDNPSFDVERFRAACETGLVTRDRKSFDKRKSG